MFGYDLQNTRSSPSSAPNMPNLIWNFEGSFRGMEGIAVSEGRVFVGTNPLIGDDDRVLIHDFYCLNETDGNVIWTAEVNGSSTYSSPTIYGEGVLVGTYTGHIYYLNKNTGLKIWETTIPERIYQSSPVVSNGRVFFGGWAYGDFGSHLYCLDITDGSVLWSFQVLGSIYSTPAVFEGKVFVSCIGAPQVYCVDEVTGTKIWEFTAGGHITTSPTVVDGRVFVGSYNNKEYCLNETNGEEIWNHTCSSWIGSSSAVADGKVYIASEDGKIYCIDIETGNSEWIYDAETQILCSPSVADGMIFFTSPNVYKPLFALNLTDGSLVWKYVTAREDVSQHSSVAIANGKLFVSFFGEFSCIGVPHQLTISPNFKDNNGYSMTISPSQWSISLPNGTILDSTSETCIIPNAIDGNYSIVSIIWQGKNVVPDNPPTFYVSTDFDWTPEINCKLPTQISVDLNTSTSLIGFWVNISSRLADYQNNSLGNEQIKYKYSFIGSDSWSTITSGSTNANGNYYSLWIPTATGNFVIKAEFLGDNKYPESNSTINLAVTPYEDENIFSVASNSSISSLTFDSSIWALTFNANGPTGTTGFVKATIGKDLISDPANFNVYLDKKQIDFIISSTGDSWILSFSYNHSTHQVIISLSPTSIPFDGSNGDVLLDGDILPIVLVLSVIVICGIVIIFTTRKRRKTNQTL